LGQTCTVSAPDSAYPLNAYLKDTFWVNLIGKGYPSPNRWFRWCTERIKINPTTSYILNTVNRNGQAIIVLGSRRAESGNRAAAMGNYDNGKRLRKHTLSNAFVYTPIANLSNDEVWAYLLEVPNPWGSNNTSLLSLYNNACSEGECPLVIETGTQSCGKSRFGCWVCTVVDRDKSMENMVENGEKWMEELLKFRNWLYDIRQQTSQYVPKYLDSRAKFGPFLLGTRWRILDKLLKMQESLSVELITPDELRYIYELLEKESEGKVKQGLKKFVFELPKGKRIAAISDFNILLTPRKRLGPLHLKRAKLVETRKMSSKYSRSTRVMYYQVSK
jgi:DNA sulfur modification protein DndC